jgi:flavin reductase (DIM6/NTAB) family NADH-FMN oxidoreductase RutF
VLRGVAFSLETLMPVDPNLFKAALGRFPAGVTVITMRDGEQDHGMTASAFCSLSLDPPQVLVCVKKTGHTHDLLSGAKGFGVNLLSADQISVSNRFAGWWDEGTSKWADLSISRGEVSGAALIGGAMAWLDCTKQAELDGGDHTIFVGRVEGAEVPGEDADLEPLVYFKGYRGVTDKLA